MSLVTRCPKCVTAFSVSADQLRAFEGLVRCGQCQNVFDGYASLEAGLPILTEKVSSTPQVIRNRQSDAPLVSYEDEPVQEQASLPLNKPFETDSEPYSNSADQFTMHHDAGTVNEQPTSFRVIGESRMRGDTPSEFGREVPRFMVTDSTPPGVDRIFWRLGVIVTLMALMLQGVYVYRHDLAASFPVLRPALERACLMVRCEVQYPKHAERLSIQASSLQQESGIQSNSDLTNFTLRFTLQNRFNKPQAWPHLMVLLTDASGAVVVRKAIPPTDYVPRQLIDRPFLPQQEVSFVVDMQVKGLAISGFEIDKFFP